MKTNHKRPLLLSMLAAGIPALGACGFLPLDLKDAMPSDRAITLRVPGAQLPSSPTAPGLFQPLVGSTSEYHANAASIATVVNTNVLDLVHRIRSISEYPPTSTQGNTYVWGPYSPGGLDPLNYRFTAVKRDAAKYNIRLEARPASSGSLEDFVVLLDGDVENVLGSESSEGRGTFNVHLDNRKQVDANWLARGEIGIIYDATKEPRSIEVNLQGFDPTAFGQGGGGGGGGLGNSGLHGGGNAGEAAQELTELAHYRYTEMQDGAGTFLFNLHINVQDSALPAAETVTLQARWAPDGSGRADSTISGEDVPTQLRNAGVEGEVIHATECWDTGFVVVFQDSSPAELRGALRPLEGDAADCAFTQADYPALPAQ